ncbi:MAG: DUF401 family protein [Nitrospirae bacterium]|nr:DUF401 family protein [Nitrospirota bacterium]
MRKKINVGYVLLYACALIFAMYLMSPYSIANTLYNTAVSPVTIEIASALVLIRMLEMILRENNVLRDMTSSMKGLLRKKRAVMVSMPLIIGMMPSVGGAYFSCPMVEESAGGLNLSAEDKAFTNYWYRHPWELVLPLYPGIVLATIITKIGIRDYILMNLSVAVAMILIGGLFCMKGVSGTFNKVSGGRVRKNFLSFVPLFFLLLLVMLFHIRLSSALLIVIAFLLVYFRYGIKKTATLVRYGLSLEILILIAGVTLFKESLQSSGAVGNISGYFLGHNVPVLPIMLVLPFISGLLTGFTLAFVGSTFPMFLSFPGITAHTFALAFAAGFAGVLLSPVHVCLVLTRDYFKADMWGLYKRIIPAVSIIFLVSVAEYLLLR